MKDVDAFVTKITYEDCIDLGESREDLKFNMTLEEYNDVMDKRGKIPPSHAKLKWKCKQDFTHIWTASYHQIKQGSKCIFCFGNISRRITIEDCVILGNGRKDLDFHMTYKEFNQAMKNRGALKPSQVKLRWICRKNSKHVLSKSYNNVKLGKGCNYCNDEGKITTYKKCVSLGNSREDLDFFMTVEEFNYAMENRGNTVPSKLNLNWICKEESTHIWKTSYNNVQNHNSGCPYCVEIFSTLGTYSHKAFQYIFTMFFLQKNLKLYSEVFVSYRYKNSKLMRYMVDLFLLNIDKSKYLYEKIRNNSKVLEELRLDPNYLKKIKAFMFDFTSDLSDQNIKDKAMKYQKKGMILFIVGTRWKQWKNYAHKRVIDTIYKNIVIIKYDLFVELIGLTGKLYNDFLHVFELLNFRDLYSLQGFSKKLRHNLLEKYGRDLYFTRDLISDLKDININYFSFFNLKRKADVRLFSFE